MSDNAHTFAGAFGSKCSRVVAGFLDYLKVEKGLAPLTVAAYTTDVRPVHWVPGEAQAHVAECPPR